MWCLHTGPSSAGFQGKGRRETLRMRLGPVFVENWCNNNSYCLLWRALRCTFVKHAIFPLICLLCNSYISLIPFFSCPTPFVSPYCGSSSSLDVPGQKAFLRLFIFFMTMIIANYFPLISGSVRFHGALVRCSSICITPTCLGFHGNRRRA